VRIGSVAAAETSGAEAGAVLVDGRVYAGAPGWQHFAR